MLRKEKSITLHLLLQAVRLKRIVRRVVFFCAMLAAALQSAEPFLAVADVECFFTKVAGAGSSTACSPLGTYDPTVEDFLDPPQGQGMAPYLHWPESYTYHAGAQMRDQDCMLQCINTEPASPTYHAEAQMRDEGCMLQCFNTEPASPPDLEHISFNDLLNMDLRPSELPPELDHILFDHDILDMDFESPADSSVERDAFISQRGCNGFSQITKEKRAELARQERLQYAEKEKNFYKGDLHPDGVSALMLWQKGQMLYVLWKNKGRAMSIQDILDASTAHFERKTWPVSALLSTVLVSVLDGAPLHYDKDAKTVMFLEEKKEITPPPEGSELIVLIYDLLYKGPHTLAELVYYAHQQGHWHSGFDWHYGRKFAFCEYINDLRKYLVIMNVINSDAVGGRVQKTISLQSKLWQSVQANGFSKDTNDYYLGCGYYAKESDLKVMEDMLSFQKTSAYSALMDHVGKNETEARLEKVIMGQVQKGPCSEEALWLMCLPLCAGDGKVFHKVVDRLLCPEGEQHLTFDSKEKLYRCVNLDRCVNRRAEHHKQQRDCLLEILRLKIAAPEMTGESIAFALRDKGFSFASTYDVQLSLRSFLLLGCVPFVHCPRFLDMLRAQVDFMIKQRSISVMLDETKDMLTEEKWDLQACRRIFNWWNEGHIPFLWKVYRKEHPVYARGATSLKRRKVEQNADEIVFNQIPSLYPYLPQEEGSDDDAAEPESQENEQTLSIPIVGSDVRDGEREPKALFRHKDAQHAKQISRLRARKKKEPFLYYRDNVDAFREERDDVLCRLDLIGQNLQQKEILKVLWQKRGRYMGVSEILQEAQVPYTSERGYFWHIKTVLGWAFEGLPVGYKKEAKEVAFLKNEQTVFAPEEGYSLLMMVYDMLFACEGKHNIPIEEIGYRAHCYGYWDTGYRWHEGQKSKFYKRLEEYKRMLTVLGFLDLSVFAPSLRPGVEADISLWRGMTKEQRGKLQSSDGFLHAVWEFVTGQEYSVFARHVEERTKEAPAWVEKKESLEQFIQSHVTQRARSGEGLWFLCRPYVKDKRAMYNFLADLVSAGKIRFDACQENFVWNYAGVVPGVVPCQDKKNFSLEMFDLIMKFPSLRTNTIVIMLRQKGFDSASYAEVQRVESCFSLLGLRSSQSDGTLSKKRQALNAMVQHNCKDQAVLGNIVLRPYEKRICVKTFSWVENKSIVPLWRAYLAWKKGDSARITAGNKHDHFLGIDLPETIVERHLPALCTFLKEAGVWELA